jgi:hypothetical protein
MKTEIIPVIHVINYEQVIKNLVTCKSLGIKKVFLISHMSANEQLIVMAKEIKFLMPDMWIGINLLGVPTIDVLTNPELDKLDAIWADVTITSEMAKKRTFKGQFFGGLAFKYQRDSHNISQDSCDEAKLSTDVATTSGAGTGMEAEMYKINTIRERLGEHPMAIASGVNTDNISHYKGIVNYLLVASSITGINEMIVYDYLKELIDKNV